MRSGIDYFPLECRLDDKMKLIKAEFGLTGRAIVVDLWCRIYSEEGYYCVWDSEVALLFASEEGVGGKVVSEVVDAAIRRGIFDRDKYEQYGILTSHGIQKRYFEAVSRRVSVEAKKEYLCFDVAKKYKNVCILGENVYRNEENVYRNGQSKVEESEVDKSIVEEDACARVITTPPTRQEIEDYIRDKGYKTMTAARFIAYYKSRGKPIPEAWREILDSWEDNDIGNEKKKTGSFDTDDFFNAALNRSYGRRNE